MSILNFFRNRNNEGKERYILCIDGGGMRGIVPVMVLQKLEQLMRENGADRAFQSYFDLIAGTSTGGLISASLSFPTSMKCIKYKDTEEVDFKDLEHKYMTIGSEIFPKGNLLQTIVNVPYQVVGDKYPVSGLENLLNQWFGGKKLSEAKVPTLLMTYNLNLGKGEILASYSGTDVSVVDACRATSAAPTYFAPAKIKDQLYADGGLIANNPSLYAYLEARKMYSDCKKFHILSLGTAATNHKTDANETSGLINWIDQIVPVYQTAQKDTVEDMLSQFADVDYVRIDKEFSASIKLDDIREKSMQTLRRFGKKLAEDNEEVLKTYASTLVR